MLCETAVAAHPGERALDDPAARQHLEALGRVGTLDDLELPVSHAVEGVGKLLGIVAVVGPDQLQPREQRLELLEQIDGAVAILHIGRMHDGVQQEALRVGRDVAFDALDFLGRIEADRINPFPPFSALLTLWLSMMAAEGSVLRCILSRNIFRSSA